MRFRNPFKKKKPTAIQRLLQEIEETKVSGDEKSKKMALEFLIPLLQSVELYVMDEETGEERLLTEQDLRGYTISELIQLIKITQAEAER